MLPLMRIHPRQFVESLDLAGYLHRQVAGVEAADTFDTAGAGEDGAAEGLIANSVRADHAHSRDDDTLFHKKSNQQLAFSRQQSAFSSQASAPTNGSIIPAAALYLVVIPS